MIAANELHALLLQSRDSFVGRVKPVCRQQIALPEVSLQLIKTAQLSTFDLAAGKISQASMTQIDQANQFNHRKPASGSLAFGLRILLLILRSVRHLSRCAVDSLDSKSTPEIVFRKRPVQLPAKRIVHLLEHFNGKILASLAVAGG